MLPVTTKSPFIVCVPLNVLPDDVDAPPCTVAPEIVPPPAIIRLPYIVVLPDTVNEPVTIGSNIFIFFVVLYNDKYYKKHICTKKP